MTDSSVRFTTIRDGVNLASVKGGVSTEVIDKLLAEDFQAISLRAGNYSDLSFMDTIKHKIKAVFIGSNQIDWQMLHTFENIQAMYVSDIKEAKIDFNHFEQLRYLESHIKKISSVQLPANSKNLEALSLVNLPQIDLAFMSQLPSLRFLMLARTKLKSLSGLESAQNLKYLNLEKNSQLNDITALLGCLKIIHLKVMSCNTIDDFSVISQLSSLDELLLAVKTDSLKFIGEMQRLKHLRLDCNLVDGNLDFLLSMSGLEDIALRNKKNHTQKEQDIKNHLKREGKFVEHNNFMQMPSAWMFVS